MAQLFICILKYDVAINPFSTNRNTRSNYSDIKYFLIVHIIKFTHWNPDLKIIVLALTWPSNTKITTEPKLAHPKEN